MWKEAVTIYFQVPLSISFEELRKIINTSGQVSLSLVQDLNLEFPKHKAGVMSTQL
jgi:hypothetical protein